MGRVVDDLPAATLKTARAGRSFWANILMLLCCYNNFLKVSGVQLHDVMAGEFGVDSIVRCCWGDFEEWMKSRVDGSRGWLWR